MALLIASTSSVVSSTLKKLCPLPSFVSHSLPLRLPKIYGSIHYKGFMDHSLQECLACGQELATSMAQSQSEYTLPTSSMAQSFESDQTRSRSQVLTPSTRSTPPPVLRRRRPFTVQSECSTGTTFFLFEMPKLINSEENCWRGAFCRPLCWTLKRICRRRYNRSYPSGLRGRKMELRSTSIRGVIGWASTPSII